MPSSRPVDEVIAKLTLESGEFQRSAYNAIDTFNKLKTTLSGDIKDNLGSMAAGIDKIASKFDFLGVLQQRLMWRISDGIINMGQNIISTATSAIREGWGEYNTKMGSVMTMKAAGYNIDDITKSLAKLNDYADKTIYSFANMTSAMSQFTTKGIDLETASAAVMGMANAAGMANVGNAELNGALRNLAQSLSMGYMDLRDWRTMDTTQIGGKAFKDTAIKEAITRGIIQDLGNGMYKVLSSGKDYNMQDMFYSALSEKWLTKDVLLGTLKQFSDANTEVGKAAYEATTTVKTLSQLMDTVTEDIGSGWANTFEIVVGNLDEASALFTAIKDEVASIVGPIGDFRNAMLQAWKDDGGRRRTLEALQNFYESFKVIIEAVVDAFNDVFRPNSKEAGDALSTFSLMLRNISKAVKSVASLLASALGPPLRIIFGIVKVIVSPLQLVWNALKRISDILEKFSRPLSLIGDLINLILDPFNKLISAVANFDAKGITGAFEGIKNLFSPIVNGFKGTKVLDKWIRLGTNAGGSNDGFRKALDFDVQRAKIPEWFAKYGSILTAHIKAAFSSLTELPEGLLKDLGKGGLKIFDTLEAFAKGTGGLISKQLGEIVGYLFQIVGFVGGALWNGLMRIWDVIKWIFKTALGASGGVLLSLLKMLSSALSVVVDLLGFFGDSMELAFKWLGGATMDALNWFVTKMNELWEVLKKLATETGFTSAMKIFLSSLHTVWSAIKSGNFWDALQAEPLRKGLPTLKDAIVDLGRSAIDTAKNGFGTLKKFIFSFLPKGVADELDAFGTALWNAVSGPVVSAWEFMVGLVTDFSGTMEESAKAIQAFLKEHQTLQGILDTVIGAIDAVITKIFEYYDAFKAGGFGALFGAIWSDLGTLFSEIGKFLSGVPATAGTFFGDLLNTIGQFASSTWTTVTDGFKSLFETLGSPSVSSTIENVAKFAGVLVGLKLALEAAGLIKALRGIAEVADPVKTIQKIFSSFSGRVLALTALAFGIAAVAKALAMLTEISWQDLAFAAGVIITVFAALGIVAKLAGSNLQSLAALGAVGFAFIGLAAAMTMVIVATQMLDDSKMSIFQEALWSFGAFIAGVAIFSKFMKGGELLKASISIFLFGVALVTLVAAIGLVAAVLQGLSVGVSQESFYAAILIFGVVAVVIWALTKMLKKANDAIAKSGAGTALFGLAGIILAVGFVIEQITALTTTWGNGDAMWAAVAMMGIVFVGLYALLYGMKELATAVSEAEGLEEKMDSVAKMMGAVGFAIAAVVAALKIMEYLDIGRAILDAIIIIATIGLLIFAANRLNVGTAYGLAAIAATIVALAVSLMLLSSLEWGQIIKGGVAIVFLAFVIAAIGAVVGLIPGVKEGLITLGVALLGLAAVLVVGFVIAAGIAYIFYAIAHSADNMSPEDVVQKLHDFVDVIVANAGAVGADIGRAAGALIAGLIIGLGNAIVTGLSILGQAISDAWNHLLGSEGPFGEAARKIQEWIDKITGWVKGAFETLGGIVDGVMNFFDDPVAGIQSWFSGDSTALPEGEVAKAKENAKKPYKEMKAGVEESSGETKQAITQASTDINTAFTSADISGAEDYKTKITDVFGDIKDSVGDVSGLKEQLSSALSFDPASMGVQNFDISQMVNITGGAELGGGASGQVLDSLTGGLEGGLGDVQGSITTLASGADEQWASYDWKTVGANATYGIAAGLEDSAAFGEVKSKARRIAQAAIDEANATLDNRSPSHVMQRIGRFAVEGFILPFTTMLSTVRNAVGTMAGTAIDTAQTAMDSMSMRPTVTPVLDISNLEKIPGVGNGLEIPIRADIRGLGSDIDGMTNRIVNSNKTVTNKINELIDKLESVELKIALQPQELDGNVITDTVEEITSIRKLLSDFGKGEA